MELVVDEVDGGVVEDVVVESCSGAAAPGSTESRLSGVAGLGPGVSTECETPCAHGLAKSTLATLWLSTGAGQWTLGAAPVCVLPGARAARESQNWILAWGSSVEGAPGALVALLAVPAPACWGAASAEVLVHPWNLAPAVSLGVSPLTAVLGP